MFADPSFLRNVDLCYIGNLANVPVCHAKHELASKELVNVSDLLHHRQIIPYDPQHDEAGKFPALGAEYWYANNFQEIKSLVLQNLGWSYLPMHMIQDELAANNLYRMKVSFDHKPWNSPVDRVTQKNRPHGPALSWLTEQIKTLFD